MAMSSIARMVVSLYPVVKLNLEQNLELILSSVLT